MGLDIVGSYYLGKQLREASDAAKQAREDQAARRAAAADVAPVEQTVQPLGQTAEMGPNMPTQEFKVGNQTTWNRDDADRTAAQMNTPDAKIARLQGVMLNQAEPESAMKLEKSATDMRAYRQRAAKAMEDEGINSFIDTNLGAAPSVGDIEAGKAGLFDLQGAEDFNKTGGKVKIPEGAKGRWKVMDYGNGRKEADFEVVGADGQPVAPISARTLQAIHAMSLHEREQLADTRADKAASQRDKTADNARLDRQLTGQLDYWKAMSDKAERWAPGGVGGAKGGGSVFERMDQNDLEEYKSSAKMIASIQEGIIKGSVDGTWDPSKNQAQQSLLLQKVQLERRAQSIMARYAEQGDSSGGQGATDPFGVRTALDDQAPAKFDVRGDPAAFRRQLVAKGNAALLEAFDKQYPGAAPKSPAAGGLVQPPARKKESPGASDLRVVSEALAADKAKPKPVDLRSKVASQGIGNGFTADDLNTLNLINKAR